MNNAAQHHIVAYVIVDLAQGETHVGEPYPVNQQMAAQSEMRRLNREQGTNRYAISAVFS